MKKGFFVTFEGSEFCGKTTQIKKFIIQLRKENIKYNLLREPGGCLISEKIRKVLLSKNENHPMAKETELLLYQAARAQVIKSKIQPALKEKFLVVCDRYYDSTTAYQGYGRGINLKIINDLNHFATDGLRPDLTFLIDLEINIAFKRKRKTQLLDRMEDQPIAFHEKIRKGFLKIAEKEYDRFVIIDGKKSIDEIHQKIWKIFIQKFKQAC